MTRTFIIAEMSANHCGKIELAKDIIKAAKEVGADAVKIQTYTADTMTLNSHNPEFHIKAGLWDGYYLYDLYKEAFTPWEWQGELKRISISLSFLVSCAMTGTPSFFTEPSSLYLCDLKIFFFSSSSIQREFSKLASICLSLPFPLSPVNRINFHISRSKNPK